MFGSIIGGLKRLAYPCVFALFLLSAFVYYFLEYLQVYLPLLLLKSFLPQIEYFLGDIQFDPVTTIASFLSILVSLSLTGILLNAALGKEGLAVFSGIPRFILTAFLLQLFFAPFWMMSTLFINSPLLFIPLFLVLYLSVYLFFVLPLSLEMKIVDAITTSWEFVAKKGFWKTVAFLFTISVVAFLFRGIGAFLSENFEVLPYFFYYLASTYPLLVGVDVYAKEIKR